MVLPEGGGKWVPAAKVKGLFPKPAPAASPPVATILFPCPKCNRSIPLQQHELSLLIECAQCGTNFVPSQPTPQAQASPMAVEDAERLGNVKDTQPASCVPYQGPQIAGRSGFKGVFRRHKALAVTVSVVVLLVLIAAYAGHSVYSHRPIPFQQLADNARADEFSYVLLLKLRELAVFPGEFAETDRRHREWEKQLGRLKGRKVTARLRVESVLSGDADPWFDAFDASGANQDIRFHVRADSSCPRLRAGDVVDIVGWVGDRCSNIEDAKVVKVTQR
jgi:hypothetical protein